MISTGALLSALLLAALAAGGIIFLAVVRHAPRGRSAAALSRGDFAEAVALAADSSLCDELVPAAMAARHLGDLETAERLARRAVRRDAGNGEAWLELGLVHGYAGELENAASDLERALAARSDLSEAVTLHRAWLALRGGDRESAGRLFDEIEIPLETKLRLDLGAGDTVFADWFFHAAVLWLALDRRDGDEEKGSWALVEARRSAPGSRLFAEDPL